MITLRTFLEKSPCWE